MSGSPAAHIQRRPSLPSVPLDSEQARLFLQSRLALFGKVATLLSLGFWLVQNVAMSILMHGSLEHVLYGNSWLHLGAMAASALVWLLCSRGTWSDAALRWMDAVGTVAITGTYATMALYDPDPAQGALVILLCLVVVVHARAIFVPSTAQRTAWTSLAASLPVTIVGTWITEGPPLTLLLRGIYVASWCAVAVILATVASRVIFGLSERVREAVQLGQYLLARRIGGGGMGEVYEARHALLRRPTAIKLIRPDRVGEEALRRFEREVTLTARLTHPNTVAIYDYGRTSDGVFYYAMEYLDGIDLQELVEMEGPLPPGRVVHILEQVCASLAEAHDLCMIHRDVKPANVVLCRRGRAWDVVKVLDFGLVKELGQPSGAHVTQANSIAGTPLYMAPESIASPEGIDGRADLYAIGAVGWFLLAGRPPFEGRTVVEVCAKHLHTQPERPGEASDREIPADLEDVLLACLEKDPADRPESADALRDMLLATSAAGTWSRDGARLWWEAAEARRAKEQERASSRPTPATVLLSIERRGTLDTREGASSLSDSSWGSARPGSTSPAPLPGRRPRARH